MYFAIWTRKWYVIFFLVYLVDILYVHQYKILIINSASIYFSFHRAEISDGIFKNLS